MPLNISPTQVAFNARGDGKFSLPFQEQVDFFRQKLNLPTEHYDDILSAGHNRAFVVAGAAKADLLNDLRGAVDKSIAEGKSIQWFRKEFAGIVQKHGWEGWTGSDTKVGRDWRTRVIYSTNIQASYNAGRYAQLSDPELIKNYPYWKYIHNDTVSHPRPLHQSWSGTVLRYDDPWWKTHFTPNGYGCRCRIASAGNDEYKGHPAPDDGTYEKIDRNGVIHTLPKGVDYGFDYAPGASLAKPLKNFIDQKLTGLPSPIGADLWQTLKPALQAQQISDVREMVAVAAASMEPAGVSVIAHVIEPGVVTALATHDIILNDAAIWLRDRELIHAVRDTKVDRNAVLPLAVWLDLPKHLEGATPYLDVQDIALLYAFDLPDETGKVVIRLNHIEKVRVDGERKKISSNFIATGGLVTPGNLQEVRYVLLHK